MNITENFSKSEFLLMCAIFKGVECSNLTFITKIVEGLEFEFQFENPSDIDLETFLFKLHNLDGLGIYKTMAKIYEFWGDESHTFDIDRRLVEIGMIWND